MESLTNEFQRCLDWKRGGVSIYSRTMQGPQARPFIWISHGSLLTAFQRLERVGWLNSEWRQAEKSRRAKLYSLTRSGRKQIEVETTNWSRRASA
jgi:DNA-binding PadR family transcriptional regulator